jgi:hypothetical protein
VRLRIDCTEAAGAVTVRVAGWIESAGVEELKRACEGVPPQLRPGLSGLRAADSGGVDALLDLERAGAELIDVPPYIGFLLSSGRRRRGEPPEGRRP